MIAAVTRRRSRISVTGPRRVLSNIQKVIFHYQEAFLAFDSYCNRNIHKKERGSSADLRPPIIRTILLLSNNVVDKGFQVIFFFFPKYDKHQPRFTSTSTEVWPRTHRCKSKLQSSEPWSNFTEVDFVQQNGLMFVKYLLIVMQKKTNNTRVETRNHHISLIRSPERDRLKSQ